MKNIEKFQKEFAVLALERVPIGVKKGVPCSCRELNCIDCDLFRRVGKSIDKNCLEAIQNWAQEEYKEPAPKLTKRERAFIECIVDDFNINRCSDGTLAIVYGRKSWLEIDGGLFAFVEAGSCKSKKELLDLEVER